MAVRLNLKREPYWLELGYGVRVFVEPMTTSLMMQAREDVAQLIDLPEDPEAEIGSNDAQRIGMAMAKAVARRVILDWEGVETESGRPAKVTPEGVDALLDVWEIFAAFQEIYMEPGQVLEREKNGSASSPSGTSAGATNTARRARPAAKSARTRKAAPKRGKASTSGG